MADVPERRVFISHIHEEAKIAGVIREWVNDVFRQYRVTAFASSDRNDMPSGTKWLKVVQENLEGAGVLVTVVSPIAHVRPWLNIELGAMWIRGVSVIPFCHSGIRADQLGRPFEDFQGVNIEDKNSGRDLLCGVAHALGLERPMKLHFEEFKGELVAAARELKYPATVKPAAAAVSDGRNPLPREQSELLQLLATMENKGYDTVPIDSVVSASSIPKALFNHHVEELREHQFVRAEWYTEPPI